MFRNHFQLGYVVRDTDGAIENMKRNFGINKWDVRKFGGDTSILGLSRCFVGDTMLELMHPNPKIKSIYSDWVPAHDTDIRIHHFGYKIDDEQDFRDCAAQFEAAGCPTAMSGSMGDILDYHYADTVAQLGHYCELIRFRQPSEIYYQNVPRN
jgi:hypothetical protein